MNTRDAYVEKSKAQMDLWNAEIERLEAKARLAKADAKIAIDQELAGVRAKRDKAKDMLARVQGASADAWQDLKRGADEAWDSLRSALQKATARFK